MRYLGNSNQVLWAAAFLAIVSMAVARHSAQAQSSVAGWPAKEYPPDKSVAVPYPNRGLALRTGTIDPADVQKFDDYYNQYLFPLITRSDNRHSTVDVIKKLGDDVRLSERAPSPQAHDRLTELGLDYMLKTAGDAEKSPVVRENAMLALGELNSPAAVKALLDTALSRTQILAVRVAAMCGLVRLASPSGKGALAADPDPESERGRLYSRIIKSMVILVKYHPPKGPNADGISWMRGQAADVLAGLASPGASGEVAPALLVMLSDTELPIPLRTKAATALGKLNYNGNPPPAAAYLQALAAFADDFLASCEKAASRARVRQITRDVQEGMKPFEASNNDAQTIDVLKKALAELDRDTANQMTMDDLKAACSKAKSAIDGVVVKN
jgi:hypothetical protein